MAPVNAGETLSRELFGRLRATVLTSATLAVDDGFGHAADSLGLIPEAGAIHPSPFDYQTNARLFIPPDLPDPRDKKFAAAAAEHILDLVEASRGRALILFTSWRNLNLVADAISGRCRFPVLRQRSGSGQMALLEEFRRTPGAVLLGTRSFWEGVDVPGEALTLLVIDKIPFPVYGDPLHRAREKRAARVTGTHGFIAYQIPLAALGLKQGLGRLSRGASDTGREPISRWNRWPRLCAGSVETSKVWRPWRASARAVAADTVVLPTPPLPPKNRICLERARASSNLHDPMASVPCPCAGAIHGSARRPREAAPWCRRRQGSALPCFRRTRAA